MVKRVVFSFLLISLTLACQTGPKSQKNMDYAVNEANFEEALLALERGQEEGGSSAYAASNAISLHLDRGMLGHYAKNYASSSNDLQNAELLIEDAYTKSVTERFFSYIINDNTKQYPGEDFEDIYLNVFNALNYYHRGDMEGALVEIRKLSISSGKLDMLARKYEYVDPDSGASIGDIVKKETGVEELPPTLSVNFSNSALARYLGALFYLGGGNTDSARIEFDQIERAFNTNRSIYSHPVPDAVEEARNVPRGKARLNIISFAGLSPVKTQKVEIFPLPFHHPILRVGFFKVPVLTGRASNITRIEVVVDGKDKFNMELLEDMGKVVEETYKARYSNIVLKTYIRTILKYAVADISASVTNNKNPAVGFAVALAARTAMDLSEKADIRMSRYIPDKAYIGGVNLDPGIYSVIINYYNEKTLVDSEEYNNVIVRQNGLNLLESVNLK